jgi:hypothetical protein
MFFASGFPDIKSNHIGSQQILIYIFDCQLHSHVSADFTTYASENPLEKSCLKTLHKQSIKKQADI